MQWLIDLIKEWVIAQGYATMAWVEAKLYATMAWVEAQDYAPKVWVQAQIYALEQWILAQKYLQVSFVDRGDPAAADFTTFQLIRDGAWHDLDLSSIIPADADAVLFQFGSSGSVVNKKWFFREKGNANLFNCARVNIVTANVRIDGDFVVPLPASRIIEYKADDATLVWPSFTVKGWWL